MNITSTKVFQYIPYQRTLQESGRYSKKLTRADTDAIPHMISAEKSSEIKGIEQEATNHARKIEADKHMVEDLVRQSNRKVMSISSMFPWSFFPNTIDVEESRITFNFRQFMSYQSHSIDIKDITNVFIESGLFFATLQVVSKTYTQNDIKVSYLKKEEAVKARRIIEGLRTFSYNNIDTSNYEITELISKLEELHTVDHVAFPSMAV